MKKLLIFLLLIFFIENKEQNNTNIEESAIKSNKSQNNIPIAKPT